MDNYHDLYIKRLCDELEFEHGDKTEQFTTIFYVLFTEHEVSMGDLDDIYGVAEERINIYDSDFSKSAKYGVMRAIERIRKG